MTQDADHDPEFEAFLRRRSPMHRRLSQIDHAEPSSELDRVVLDRARNAIGAPTQEPIYRKSRWAMPLGLAATILIAFTVVLNIDHRRAGSVGQHASNATARLADTPAAAPVTPMMELAPPEAVAGSDAAAGAGAAQAAKSSSSPAPARAFADNRSEAESDEASFPDGTNAADIAARRDRTLASNRSLMSGAVSATGSTAQPPAPQSAPPPAPADVHASPDAWLSEINRLRAAGKNEEADREYAAFRRAYPAHPGYSLAQPPTR